MIITTRDIKRLEFVFNKRIEELGKISFENPDIREEIGLEIQEYIRTLNKYKQFNGNED